MEIIPVAITSAKYPGNRSAAARKTAFLSRVAGLFIRGGFRRRLFVAAFAIKFEANSGGAALFSQNPRSSRHRRIVPEVLSMTAFQNGAPMVLIVLIKACDLLLHLSLLRTYPLLVFLREVGRHHLMIESVIAKQRPEATTSGIKTE